MRKCNALKCVQLFLFAVVAFAGMSFRAAAQTEDATADSAIEALFKPDNPIGLIIRDFPDERPTAQARLRQAYQSGGSAALQQITYVIGRELGEKYTRHYAARASDETILHYLDMEIQATAELATTSPAACVGWLTNTGGEVHFSPYLTQMLAARFAELVASGAKSQENQRLLTADEMQPMSNKIVQSMVANFPESHRFFDGMGNPTAVTDPEGQQKTCYTFLAFFKSVGALDPGDAAAYFRTSMVSQ